MFKVKIYIQACERELKWKPFMHASGTNIVHNSSSNNYYYSQFLDPPLDIEMDPPFIAALDVSPFNIIFLTCNVTQPEAVTLTKQIAWIETSPSGRLRTLNDTGSITNITYAGLEDAFSVSTLSMYTTSAGTWRFKCIASLDVPGDPLIIQSETAIITVNGNLTNNVYYAINSIILILSLGASAPVKPMDIVHTTVTADHAIIEWLIPVIAYTPETYIVNYGPDEAQLNFTSDTVIGTRDITARNQIYSTTISDLQSNTTYYYQVVAENSVEFNKSRIAQLVTAPPSK